MSDDIRYQRKCYYASSNYSESFWGKFIYLYQGKGSLRLTTHAICLEGGPGAVEIPFTAIKSIRLGRFSSWSKPLGLSRLTVSYTQDGQSKTTHLIPYESNLDSTMATSELVASWHETLSGVEKLTNRVEPPHFQPEPASIWGKVVLVSLYLVCPLVAFGVVMWFINVS